jgi:hypothetical protein
MLACTHRDYVRETRAYDYHMDSRRLWTPLESTPSVDAAENKMQHAAENKMHAAALLYGP